MGLPFFFTFDWVKYFWDLQVYIELLLQDNICVNFLSTLSVGNARAPLLRGSKTKNLTSVCHVI